MLIAALYFREPSTNIFQLPCGMLTPTLFDVAAITGLSPLGGTFDPTIDTKLDPGFDFERAGFNNYIKDHFSGDHEHVAFLTFWLSFYIFCSGSLQVAKKYISLATQIHEGKNICLSRLILGCLYESLLISQNAFKARLEKPTSTLLMLGPFWLLQLWLNATFETSLSTTLPYESERRVEGERLAKLTPNESTYPCLETFGARIDRFFGCKEFLSTMAPFVSRRYGPEWFRATLPANNKRDEQRFHDIWKAFLKPDVLSTRIQPDKGGYGLAPYQPNLVTRQFGFSQFLPKPFFTQLKNVWLATDTPKEEWYTACSNYHKNKKLTLNLSEFELSFHCTERFEKWWSKYYENAPDLNTLQQRLTDSFSFMQKDVKKSRALPLNPKPKKKKEEAPTATTTKKKDEAATTTSNREEPQNMVLIDDEDSDFAVDPSIALKRKRPSTVNTPNKKNKQVEGSSTQGAAQPEARVEPSKKQTKVNLKQGSDIPGKLRQALRDEENAETSNPQPEKKKTKRRLVKQACEAG